MNGHTPSKQPSPDHPPAEDPGQAQAAAPTEPHFRTLANAIPQLCWMADADGWISWYNNRWYEYTGTTPEQMEGWGWQSVHDPELLPTVLERWKSSIATGQPFEMVFPLRGADGVFRPFLTRIVPVSDDSGATVRWFGTNTDISAQRATEQALRESDERLRRKVEEVEKILDALPASVWIAADPECRRITGNRAANEMLGTPPGANLSQADPAGEAARLTAFKPDGTEYRADELPLERAVASGRPVRDALIEFRQPGRPSVHALGSAAPLFDDAGHVRGGVAAFTDVTKLRGAEEALRRSHDRLNLHVDNSPLAVVEWDSEFRITRWAGEAERVFGWTAGEVVGRKIDEIPWVFEEDIPLVTAVMADMISGKRPSNVNKNRNVRKDGVVIHCEWYNTSLCDASGRLVSVLSQVLDVTEQRRAEQALRESEARERARAAELEAVMDAVPIATFVMRDPECREIVGNRMTHELLRIPKGGNISGAVPGGGPRPFRAMKDGVEIPLPAQKAAATGTPIRNYEFDVLFPDGTSHSLLGNAVPLLDEQNRVRGAVGGFLDITERKELQRRLFEKQKLESVGLLAGGIAHDFNNLLVGILGNASLAQDIAPPDSELGRFVGEIVRAGERAAHLTRQMLAYSGKGRFLVEPVDLSAMVEEITRLLQPSIPTKVALRLELERDLPPVEADAGQIQQVVMNLVINAAEAIGDAPGVVSVRTGARSLDRREIRRAFGDAEIEPGVYVSVEVRDSGCGMDAATKARIFDPFFTTKFTGRGLGLAAVAGIVRGHKGAIAISSAPGQGSTFLVVFPAMPSAAPPENTPLALSEAELHGAGTVLVVDDEELVLRTARTALERHGYSVLEAENGPAAIEILKREKDRISAVVLDLTMPGMSGHEALPLLREVKPDLQVIITSGYSETETMRLFSGLSLAAFIQKPFTAGRLAEALKRALGRP